MKYDEKTLKELTAGLLIDRDNLEAECIQQANSFFHASEGFAYAVSARDQRKMEHEAEIAGIDRDIREEAAAEGEKTTEAQIKHQISSNRHFQISYKEYLEDCLFADRWQGIKDAYRQRADMLKNLVLLRNANYFGEVTGAAERSDARATFTNRNR